MWHHNLTFSNTLYSSRWTILLDYKYYIEYIICVFFLYNDSYNYDWPKLMAKNQRLIGKNTGFLTNGVFLYLVSGQAD